MDTDEAIENAAFYYVVHEKVIKCGPNRKANQLEDGVGS
jgi:hypothetical protein